VIRLDPLPTLAPPPGIGEEMHRFMAELYPICRSLTGDGVRETLRRIQKHVPLTVHEVPSGTPVLDWTVPKEWTIRDAWVADARGRRVIDFQRSNLHVVGYSVPVRASLSLRELRPHLHTLPDRPHWIPYRTSYWEPRWGFCLPHAVLESLDEGPYEVVIDSTLEDGHLAYGECVLPGEEPEEVLISAHVCHPSLANDNLSGIAVATFLARALGDERRRYSYRFLFAPGTIGAITWLARNETVVPRIRAGLVVVCVGDPGHLTWKKTRRGDTELDRAVAHVLRHSGRPHEIVDFSPYGYDERQYGSPGFDLAVGSLSRTPHARFPQYHTSADDLDFVRPECLADSFAIYRAVLGVLDNNRTYRNLHPKGEPQLGRRGLYRSLGGHLDAAGREMAMLWVLNLSDGRWSLLDIAERSGLPFTTVRAAADLLLAHGLLA
jgi:aminopeptidase-like protein